MTEIRLLGNADAEALDRFLGAEPSGITLRGAVRRDGVASERTTCAGALEDGKVVAVTAIARAGIYLVAQRNLEALLGVLARAGRGVITGLSGFTPQVMRALAWLDAADAPTLLSSRDELFSLDLSRLRDPAALHDGSLRVRAATPADEALMTAWRHDFSAEYLGAQRGERLLDIARQAVKGEIAEGTLHLLEDSGRPVATAGFDPELADVVQVAYVFTPPELRGRGYAKAVTAGILLQARARGAREAVLHTGLDNAPAQHAYRALGFQSCGPFKTVIFAQPRLPAPGG